MQANDVVEQCLGLTKNHCEAYGNKRRRQCRQPQARALQIARIGDERVDLKAIALRKPRKENHEFAAQVVHRLRFEGTVGDVNATCNWRQATESTPTPNAKWPTAIRGGVKNSTLPMPRQICPHTHSK